MTPNLDLKSRAMTPVSAASAAIFRIGFGLAGVLLVVRFFANGWVETLYLDPSFHFTYPGFDWVAPLPRVGMYLVFSLIGLAALAVAAGFKHRLFSVVLAVGLAYVELIDVTLYLNHYYWMVLTALVLAFLPVSDSLSVDAWRGRIDSSAWIPAWVVWMLRFQVGMVYVFAGIAKLNADWLLRAEPLSTWLPARSELWLIGPALTLPVVAIALSWAGALFDLTIVFWLSLRRTRRYAYVLVLVFHLTTWVMFPAIGLFPLIMSIGALVFFEPDWPLRLDARRRNTTPPPTGRLSPGWLAVAGIYALVMVVVPMRHHLAGGDGAWSGDGYLGSWHVMLNERSGSAEFIVWDDEEGTQWRVGPPGYLTERQVVVMATSPSLIARAAELVSADNGGLAVSADVKLSINGRPSAQFTDPEVIIAGRSASVSGDWLLASPAR